MKKVFTYVRINKNNEKYTEEQKNSLKKYLLKNKLEVSQNFEVEINTPKEEKNILILLKNCEKDSVLVVSDLNVFGRTVDTIVEIIKFLLKNKIRILVTNQNLDLVDSDDVLTQMILSIISMTVDLERDLMSLRTKEALTEKKLNGVALGKPKGTIQKSKFDQQRDKIEELLQLGLSVRKIAKLLGYNNHIGLNNYVKKRHIRENLPNTLEIAS